MTRSHTHFILGSDLGSGEADSIDCMKGGVPISASGSAVNWVGLRPGVGSAGNVHDTRMEGEREKRRRSRIGCPRGEVQP